MKKHYPGISIFFIVTVILAGLRGFETLAQEQVSATPVPVSLPTATPFSTEQFAATSTATRTPTAAGPVLLEPRETAGPVNVRLLPDPDADRLGVIAVGERFPVIGQYFQWYQIQYELSPNGRAWIFGQLVDIIGDASAIPSVDPFTEPTVDTAILDATQTWEAITQTPGGILTATANARVLPAPTNAGGGSDSIDNSDVFDRTAEVEAPAPTFTYPADVAVIAPTRSTIDVETDQPASNDTTADSGGIPPLLSIVVLVGLGLLGLFISSFRR